MVTSPYVYTMGNRIIVHIYKLRSSSPRRRFVSLDPVRTIQKKKQSVVGKANLRRKTH